MARSAAKKASKTAVWIIILLLVVGLAGFGATNFGGSVRSLGTVGDTEIDVNRYARELNQELNALSAQLNTQIGLAQAQQLGIDRAVLQRLVSVVALENEAATLGISIGDAEIADQVLQVPAFQGLDGSFDREAYRFTLERAGLSEAAYEDSLRAEVSRTLLQAAVGSGVRAPGAYTDTIIDHLDERRSFTYLRLGPDALEQPISAPGDADLRAHYDANPDAYMLPETRVVTYAWLTPEMVAGEIEPDDAALRALYEARADEFSTPERRLVERLVFGTAEQAAEAKARIDAGETGFEDLVAERGLDLGDIDLGDVTESDLGAAGPAVFGAESPGVVGPVDTDLGPALIRVNAILNARTTSFEEARDGLMDDYALDRARRQIADLIDAVDDLLAGGATLEELDAETEMRTGTVEWTADSRDGIAAYSAFRDATAAAQPGDFPEVLELDDGGIFALRLDEVVEPRLQPFEDARERVAEDWRRAETTRRLAARAEALMAEAEAGAALASLGDVTLEENLTRSGFVPGTPRDFLEQVFAMAEGELRVVEGDGAVYLVRLDTILPPDPDDPDTADRIATLGDTVAQGIGEDLLQGFVAAIEARARIELNQAAINAVHANFR